MRAYGMYPVIALGATVAVEQGERLSLAQAFDGIKAEFGVSDTMLGALSAAMVLVGVVGSIPIGALADRWHRRSLLVIAMAIWTVCMGLGAVAPTFALLFATRLGVGAVEANGPAAFSLLSDYYPVASRARMMGRYQTGAAVGGLIGIVLSGVLIDEWGWRAGLWMWLPFGVLTMALLLRLPDPERGGQDRAFHREETERVDVDGVDGLLPDLHLPAAPPVAAPMRWRDVVRVLVGIRSMWFGVLALTLSSFLLGALGAWGIEFIKRVHGVSASQASVGAPAIGAGAALGMLGGGIVADRLLQRGVTNARVYVSAIASIAASLLLLPAVLTSSLPLALVLLFFGATCLTLPVAPAEALLSDVVPYELRGRAASVRSVVRSLSALAPWIVGLLSDATDLQTALATVAPMYAAGGFVMLFAARTYPRDLAAATASARLQPNLTRVSDSPTWPT